MGKERKVLASKVCTIYKIRSQYPSVLSIPRINQFFLDSLGLKIEIEQKREEQRPYFLLLLHPTRKEQNG